MSFSLPGRLGTGSAARGGWRRTHPRSRSCRREGRRACANCDPRTRDYSWDGPAEYWIENLDDKPFEALVVEVKN
jgi:hypothetical protein